SLINHTELSSTLDATQSRLAYLLQRNLIVGKGAYGQVCIVSRGKVEGYCNINHRGARSSLAYTAKLQEGANMLRDLRGHDNVIRLYDVFCKDNELFILTELGRGGNMLQLLMSHPEKGMKRGQNCGRDAIWDPLPSLPTLMPPGPQARESGPKVEGPLGGCVDAIKALIMRGIYTFPHELFRDVSDEALDFVSCLMSYSVECRCTAERALTHSWLRSHCDPDQLQRSRDGASGTITKEFRRLSRKCICKVDAVTKSTTDHTWYSIRKDIRTSRIIRHEHTISIKHDLLLTNYKAARYYISKVGAVLHV
ncbi:hypothetical protein ACHAXA_007126, partial [Cyclostephanos tholiformis]